ncbi:MAG: hypothetical protein WBD99_05700 [Thermodesulfobacteriota bacterium]
MNKSNLRIRRIHEERWANFLTIGFVLLVITSACVKRPPPTEEVTEPFPRVGDEMSVVEFYWAKRNLNDLIRRVQIVSESVAGYKLEDRELYEIFPKPQALNHWISPFKDAPHLKIKVIPEYDELRVINGALVDMVDVKDVGEESAVEIATNYLRMFSNAGLLSIEAFNFGDIQVGYGIIGEGSMDEKFKVEHVTEYRITFRPNINGIQLANAGVRISIHRTGALVGVRLGGVTMKAWDGKTVERVVSPEEIRTQFQKMIREDSQAIIAWARPMYVMPEDAQTAVVTPLQVFSYSLKTKVDDKYEVSSRRKIVGLSLTDPTAVAIDFTAPTRNHTGTSPDRDLK